MSARLPFPALSVASLRRCVDRYVTAEKGQGKKRKQADPSAEEVERVKEYLEKCTSLPSCRRG